jgi:hypothetical protein
LKLKRFIFIALFYAVKRKGRQKEKIYRKEMQNEIINNLTLDCILGIKQDQ